jgi:ABC-type dipeptide/oligopeptide/nickel transport system ATPase component
MPLLAINNLHTYFRTREGEVRAVDGVSFSVERGTMLGIVGESGCGKSVTALSIMGLIQLPGRVVDGTAVFQGRDLLKLKGSQLEDVRGKEIGMIFQDPMTSLNPTLTIGTQITETLRRHLACRSSRLASVRSSCCKRCTSRTLPPASTTTRTATRAECGSA